jgi:chromosomal replication initiation ATPase DnaA
MGRHSVYRVTALEDTDYSETMRQQSRAASEAFADHATSQPPKIKPVTVVFAPEIEMLKRTLTERDIALNEAAAKLLEKDKRIGELCLELESRSESSDPCRANRIARAVAKAHGLSFHEMISPRRHANIVRARQHAMWELRKNTSLSLPQIARIIGVGDHTTVLHGCRMHETRLARGEA